VLLNRSKDSLGVRANHFRDFTTIFEEQKCGHGADAEVLSDVADLVDVNLVELGIRELFGVLGDDGGDGLAGATPDGEAVEDDQGGAGVLESFVESFFVCDIVNTHFD